MKKDFKSAIENGNKVIELDVQKTHYLTSI